MQEQDQVVKDEGMRPVQIASTRERKDIFLITKVKNVDSLGCECRLILIELCDCSKCFSQPSRRGLQRAEGDRWNGLYLARRWGSYGRRIRDEQRGRLCRGAWWKSKCRRAEPQLIALGAPLFAADVRRGGLVSQRRL